MNRKAADDATRPPRGATQPMSHAFHASGAALALQPLGSAVEAAHDHAASDERDELRHDARPPLSKALQTKPAAQIIPLRR